ncbi:MAG: LysR family transcriptional regulator [Colwellia sp.]|nr:LysR family transcriptional regulator [Colwellia sp.]
MLNSIRIFIKVVEQGSFSKAGRILNMATSSVTRNLDQLEKELGVTLLKRSTRQLILTEEGSTFIGGANELLTQANELTASLKTMNAEPEGVLRISVFESFGRMQVCSILPEFLENFPKVKVEIELENRMVDLMKEEIDLAIRIGRPIDSGLKARKIMPNHTLICASPAYITKHGSPLIPDDLMLHNCLVIGNKRQKSYWHFNKTKKHKKIAIGGNLTSLGGTPILQAAIKGIGIALLSNWMISDYVREGKLVVCLPEWDSSMHESTSGDVYAVYTNSNYIKPSIRAFIDFLIDKTH